MSTLILTNPNGYRVQRNLPRLQGLLEQLAGVEHRMTHDLAELDNLLASRKWQRDDLIVVNGGDGTVQNLLTGLMARSPPAAWPKLAILPGGTTNMTALAFNRSRSYRGSLAILKKAVISRQAPSQERRLLQVNCGNQNLVGVFFGASAIVRGIEFFHQRLNQRSQWGVGQVVLRAAWSMARRQPPFAEPTRIRLGDSDEYDALILLITSLDRLILGTRPYWGQQPGSLHLTLIEQQAPHFLRYLPRLIRGKPGRALQPENGYHSRNLDQLSLSIDGPFTIDGEIFDCQGQNIQLAASDPVEVLAL